MRVCHSILNFSGGFVSLPSDSHSYAEGQGFRVFSPAPRGAFSGQFFVGKCRQMQSDVLIFKMDADICGFINSRHLLIQVLKSPTAIRVVGFFCFISVHFRGKMDQNSEIDFKRALSCFLFCSVICTYISCVILEFS